MKHKRAQTLPAYALSSYPTYSQNEHNDNDDVSDLVKAYSLKRPRIADTVDTANKNARIESPIVPTRNDEAETTIMSYMQHELALGRTIDNIVKHDHIQSNGLLLNDQQITAVLTLYNNGTSKVNEKISRKNSGIEFAYSVNLVTDTKTPNKAYLIIYYRDTAEDTALYSAKNSGKSSGVLAEGGMSCIRIAQIVDVYAVNNVWQITESSAKRFAVRKVSQIKAQDEKIKHIKRTMLKNELDITRALVKNTANFPIFSYPQPEKEIMIMPFFAGIEVFDLINEGELSPKQRTELIIKIMESLSVIHNAGYIHRDIKPENIIVQMLGDQITDVQIIDFGLAMPQNPAAETAIKAGSYDYIPPEVMIAQSFTPNVALDFYSVGAIAKTLLGALKSDDCGYLKKKYPLVSKDGVKAIARVEYITAERELSSLQAPEDYLLFQLGNALMDYQYLSRLSNKDVMAQIQSLVRNFEQDINNCQAPEAGKPLCANGYKIS